MLGQAWAWAWAWAWARAEFTVAPVSFPLPLPMAVVALGGPRCTVAQVSFREACEARFHYGTAPFRRTIQALTCQPGMRCVCSIYATLDDPRSSTKSKPDGNPKSWYPP